MADSTSVKQYRVEQLRGGQWETIPEAATNLGWQAIDHCTNYQRFSARFATRVVRTDTEQVWYYLDERGRRDYNKESH